VFGKHMFIEPGSLRNGNLRDKANPVHMCRRHPFLKAANLRRKVINNSLPQALEFVWLDYTPGANLLRPS